jgi:hypothetical protein
LKSPRRTGECLHCDRRDDRWPAHRRPQPSRLPLIERNDCDGLRLEGLRRRVHQAVRPSAAQSESMQRAAVLSACRRYRYALWRTWDPMTNLFAFRATRPRDMMAAADPIGPENDKYLSEAALRAGVVVAAWGVHGSHLRRDVKVRSMVRELHYLKLTTHGHPGHSLYLQRRPKPVAWQGRSCDVLTQR